MTVGVEESDTRRVKYEQERLWFFIVDRQFRVFGLRPNQHHGPHSDALVSVEKRRRKMGLTSAVLMIEWAERIRGSTQRWIGSPDCRNMPSPP